MAIKNKNVFSKNSKVKNDYSLNELYSLNEKVLYNVSENIVNEKVVNNVSKKILNKVEQKKLVKNKKDLDILKGLYSELYADFLGAQASGKNKVNSVSQPKIELTYLQKAIKSSNEKNIMDFLMSPQSNAQLTETERDRLHEILSTTQIDLCSSYYLEQALSSVENLENLLGRKVLESMAKEVGSLSDKGGNVGHESTTNENGELDKDKDKDKDKDEDEDENVFLKISATQNYKSYYYKKEDYEGNVEVKGDNVIDEKESFSKIEMEKGLIKVEDCLKNLIGWWAQDASTVLQVEDNGVRTLLIEKLQWLKSEHNELWGKIVSSVNDLRKKELKNVYYEAELTDLFGGEASSKQQKNVKLLNPIATSFYKGFDFKLWESMLPQEDVKSWASFESLLLNSNPSDEQKNLMKKKWELAEDLSNFKNSNSLWNVMQLGPKYVEERLLHLYEQIMSDGLLNAKESFNAKELNEESGSVEGTVVEEKEHFIARSKRLSMIKEFSLLLSMGVHGNEISKELMRLQAISSRQSRQEFVRLFNSIDAEFDFFRKKSEVLGFKSSKELLKEKSKELVLKDVHWSGVLESLKSKEAAFDEKSLKDKDYYSSEVRWWGKALVDMHFGLSNVEKQRYQASSSVYSLKEFCDKAMKLELFDVIKDVLQEILIAEKEYKQLYISNKEGSALGDSGAELKDFNLNARNLEEAQADILNSLLKTLVNKDSFFVDENSSKSLFFVLLENGAQMGSISNGSKEIEQNEKVKKWMEDESFVEKFKKISIKNNSLLQDFIKYLPANSLSSEDVLALVEKNQIQLLWANVDKVNWHDNYEKVKEVLKEKSAVGFLSFVEWSVALSNDDIQKAKRMLIEDENFLYSIEKNYGTEICIKDALKKGALSLLDEMVLLNWPVKDVLVNDFDNYLNVFIKNPSSRVWQWFCGQMETKQGWMSANKDKVFARVFSGQPNLATIGALFDLNKNVSWALSDIKASRIRDEDQKRVNALFEYVILKTEGKKLTSGGEEKNTLQAKQIVSLFSQLVYFLNNKQKSTCLKAIINSYPFELKKEFDSNKELFYSCAHFIDKESCVEHIKKEGILSEYMYAQILSTLATKGEPSALKEVKEFSKKLDPTGSMGISCLKNCLQKSPSQRELKAVIGALTECTNISLASAMEMMCSCNFHIDSQIINNVIKAFPSVKFKSMEQNLGTTVGGYMNPTDQLIQSVQIDGKFPVGGYLALPMVFNEWTQTTKLLINKMVERNGEKPLAYENYKKELLLLASQISLPSGNAIEKSGEELTISSNESAMAKNCRKVFRSLILNDLLHIAPTDRELVCSFFAAFPDGKEILTEISDNVINLKGCALVSLSRDLMVFKNLSPMLKADLDVCYEFAKNANAHLNSSIMKGQALSLFKEFNSLMVKDLSLEVSNINLSEEKIISKNFTILEQCYEDKYSTNPLKVFKRRNLNRKQAHWVEYANAYQVKIGSANNEMSSIGVRMALSGIVNKIDDADKSIWIDSFNEFEKNRESLIKEHSGNLLEQDIVLLKRLVDVNLPDLISKWSALPIDERHIKVESEISANEALKKSFEDAMQLLEQMRTRAINNAHLSFKAEVAVVSDKLSMTSFQNVVGKLQEDLMRDIQLQTGVLESSTDEKNSKETLNSQIEFKKDFVNKKPESFSEPNLKEPKI